MASFKHLGKIYKTEATLEGGIKAEIGEDGEGRVRILSPEKHVTSSITVHDITEWESDKAFSRKATKGILANAKEELES